MRFGIWLAAIIASLISFPAFGQGGTFIRASGSGGGSSLSPLVTDSDTIAYWAFDGNLVSDPVITTPLNVVSGAAIYTRARGLTGVICDDLVGPTTADHYQTADITLNLNNDMTAHVLMQVRRIPTARYHILGYDSGPGDAGAPADNYAYAMTIETIDGEFRYFAEEGLSGNHTAASTTGGPALYQIFLFTLSRLDNVVTLYVDGEIVAGPTDMLVPTESGVTSDFNLCQNGDGGETAEVTLFGVKIRDVGETDAEVLAQAQAIGVAQ